MLDVLNRYAHGFVVVPVVLACRRGGVFQALAGEALSHADLCARLGANSGHMRVTLRLLESLGWIDVDGEGRIRQTDRLKEQALIPGDIQPLIDADMDAWLRSADGAFVDPYIARSRRRWQVGNDVIADYLDSLLVVPILGLLAKHELLAGLPDSNFSALGDEVRAPVIELLRHLEWLQGETGSFGLTPAGQFMFERAMNLGVAESYRPMLKALPELLFGDAKKVFARDADGHETHVDRTLNVIASGFMHDRFFAEVEDILISVFSQEPLSNQPRYVADMGSGDGTFLKRVYETVRDKTPRGEMLDQYPLTVIGIDFNEASLKETSRTLGDIDHIVVTGDIGNPQQAMQTLGKLGIDCGQVLHIRSFLDHDRPYEAPTDRKALEAREGARYLGAYVDPDGAEIRPAEAVQSLVEHLGRWADVINDHGLILLEVHCQDPQVVRKFIDQSESLYFDAIEGYSHQLLVEPDVALMAAAEVGLFPRRDEFRKFPNVLPYCRITLGRYERRPYRVRMARQEDLPALLELEDACWVPAMRSSREQLATRLSYYPLGQWVLEMEGRIVAVVYSQRIRDIESLKEQRLEAVSELHDPDGPVVQLLGLNVLPEAQQLGLGDQLRDLILLRSSLQGGVRQVAGVTRCGEFRGKSIHELRQYVQTRDESGRPIDPVLRFHVSQGARIVDILEGFRPGDVNNHGAGILICYDLCAVNLDDSGSQDREQANVRTGDVRTRLESCLKSLLGPHRHSAFSWTRTLRDIGLDSLDLLEFRTLLQNTFDVALSPTFFFSHATLDDIERFFAKETGAPASGGKPRERIGLAAPAEAPAAPATAVLPAPGRESSAIAIVGMAGMFPGCANIDEYWELLSLGRDGITEIPADRWDVDAYYSADPDAPGKIVSRFGGFLDGMAEFDAAFFGIAPSEARLMDPQQRKLLEVHWEALENAGIDPRALKEKACGIFVGLHSHDYELLQVAEGDGEDLGAWYATGNSPSIAAGRIAYFLGTRGPALTVDTACSSSLVAVHQAMRSLKSGESDIAIASGVNLLLSPRLSIAFSKAGMLSPRGRCRTFDAGADGYVRSEGCAAVVLKRLGDAERDGDPVLAVLRGSAINHDGASNGLTAPSLPAQQALLRAALDDAGLRPADIAFVEAHGTGTNLGDPVEFAAIREVFGGDAERAEPLWLGSAKTNIGHAEAAAGIAGLVKVVLSLQHRKLPGHLHFEKPNPHIDLEALPARVPAATTEWVSAGPRRAGVSSFGFSGTNAHVIVEEVPQRTRQEPPTATGGLELLPLSARSADDLKAVMNRYAAWLESGEAPALADICRSAASGRAHFSERRAIIGSDHAAMARHIRHAIAELRERAQDEQPPRIAFMFTGQGSQYLDMARDLAVGEPAFRDALAECCRVLDRELDTPLEEVLYPADASGQANLIDNTAYTQPALFAVEYALARMLQHWGIEPAALIGHSVGEYVAACIAGVFSLEDGLRLIAARARLMGSLPAGGAMAAVLGPPEQVMRLVEASGGTLSIAAINGPANTVISGADSAVRQATGQLESAGAKVVPLQVSHAFHSALMEPIVPAFGEVLRWVRFSEPRLPIASNVTGRFAGSEIATAEYWSKHLRNAVRFADGIAALLDDGVNVMLEVGPHPVLTGMGQLVADERQQADVLWVPTLSREKPARQSMIECMTALYESGVDPDWSAFHGGTRGRKVRLPNYPWRRKSFWFRERHPAESRRQQPEMLFEPRWSAQGRLDCAVPGRVASGMPAPAVIAASLVAVREEARAGFADSAVVSELDEECRNLAVAALRRLGWKPVRGDTVAAHSLADQLGVLPKYRRLLHRLLQMMAEDGHLAANGKEYTIVSELPCVPSRLDELRERYPECSSEFLLLGRCSAALDQVLAGAVDPLDLIFPNGDMSAAETVYTTAPFAQVGNALAVAAIESIVNGRGSGMPLRVLEIGAGTGGTTASILPLLPADTDYVFTDLSSAFFDRARSRFRDYPNVRYELLDAEQAPSSQGFAARQFDLVIASNALHATQDLAESLRHASQLLSERGVLLLIEGLEPSRWVDLVFGLTDGWWRFNDTNLRPDYPLLRAAQWRNLLPSCGFGSVDVVGMRAAQAAGSSVVDLLNQGLVIAQAAPLADVATVATRRRPANWLVLGDRGGVGARFAEVARREGDHCELIGADATQARIRESVAAARSSSDKEPARLVDLRPLDIRPDCESAATTMDEATAVGMNTIDVVRALATGEQAAMTAVTRQAQCIRAGEVASALGATVWGLGNVIAAEYPTLALKLVDLDPGTSDEAAAEELYEELAAGGGGMRVAFRSGQRFVPWFHPVVRQEDELLVCDAQGVYLILGGMGDLGLHTARWLARHGARNIVLAGRTLFPPETEWPALEQDPFYGPKIDVVRELTASGIEPRFMEVDIRDRAAVDALVRAVSGIGPVRGLVQAAAIISDQLVGEIEKEQYRRVLGPKVAGTLHLLQALSDQPLDFCLFYSSIGSVVGLPGQASYAAANAFLDALATSMNRPEKRFISINWCGWRDTGLARTGGGQRAIAELELLGIGSLSPDEATRLIGRALGSGRAQATAIPLVPMDGIRPGGLDPLLADLRRRYCGDADARPAALPQATAGSALAGLDEPVLSKRVQQLVIDTLAQLLDIERGSVDVDRSLGDIGMDSLLGLEFRKALQAQCEVVLPATLVWSYPTARAVIDRIVELLVGPSPTRPRLREPLAEETRPAVPRDDTAVDSLSDDEALRQLMDQT